MAAMTRAWFDLSRPEMDIRIYDGFPPFEDHVKVHDFTEPGIIHRDERVTVTAAVVHHPPVAPAFALRFDCPDRSIVFSGDTSKSANVVALAKGADILVHEVEDMRLVEKMIRGMPGRNLEAGLRHHYETHTAPEAVGEVAAAAGVGTLVLSHFAPNVDDPDFNPAALVEAVRKNFQGRVVVGHDLLEL
jgi:ribonuclease BN (tRNA processing enzyme)